MAAFMAWRETQFDALDKNKKGYLTREDLAAGKTRIARKLLANFDLIDTNQDQKISREEFQAAGRRRFLMFDTGRKGYLTREELEKLVVSP